MDAEDCIRTDVDAVTVLPCEDDAGQEPECSEVEELHNRYGGVLLPDDDRTV